MMDYSNFTKLASTEISYLYETIEAASSDIDIDLFSDVLHIYTNDGEYVINQHSPTQQIWLSSPISNAGYFSYDEDKQAWLDKNGISLRQRLSADLNLKKVL